MIENFIDSVLIIDDSESEISELQTFFTEKDIRVDFYTPNALDSKKGVFKNRKLLIIDLYLVDSDNLTNNIARIRRYLKTFIGKEFGNYGVILWTKHLENLNEFRDKIKLDQEKYNLPLFIIGLDKTKYLRLGNYNDVIIDLNTAIIENVGASFFINWNSLVRIGKEKTINQIFDLVKDYNKQEEDLKFILLKLAHNYTGIPIDQSNEYGLEHDAIKAMSELLNYDITNTFKEKTTLFDNIKEIKNPEDEQKIYGELNSRLLLDFTNISQNNIIPGNVYEIINNDDAISNYIISEICYKKGKNSTTVKSETILNNIKNIIIEVTPPCDFAQNKKSNRSRFISGIMFDFQKDHKDFFKGESYYTELFPIRYKEDTSLKAIVFDFKYFSSINEDQLKDQSKFKILFRAKDKLFSDILQKLSSHTARLGLAVIH